MKDPNSLLAPLLSLISKSEKAIMNLKPGSWQYTMLDNNLKALRYASAWMDPLKEKPKSASDTEIQEYLKSLDSMIAKTEAAQKKFLPGSAQYSLLKNRLNALQSAFVLINGRTD